jgi:hypothetical protein
MTGMHMPELTHGQLRERMSEVDIDLGALQRSLLDYLESGLLPATNIGRPYSVGDPKQREAFAEWFVGMLETVYRFDEARRSPQP